MTFFLRVVDAQVDRKADALREALNSLCTHGQLDSAVYSCAPEDFSAVPGSPFAYWVSDAIRALFKSLPPYATDGRTAGVGVQTNDDFRFVRLWFEITSGREWPTLARGGRHGSTYGDLAAVLNWRSGGYELKASIAQRYGSASRHIQKEELYFSPGMTWPLRGIRLQASALPRGSIFSMAGKAAFATEADLPALLALFNSRAFDFLVCIRAGKVGGVQYESGLIQGVPTPAIPAEAGTLLTRLARRAWSLKRSLDTRNEASHAFLLPPGPNENVTGLDEAEVQRELGEIQKQIDDAAFSLYGVNVEERANIEAPNRQTTSDSDQDEDELTDDTDEADDETAVSGGSDAVCSWLLGVAFGRFDPRLATSERPIPPEPEPFDPLPARSPGMYPEDEEPADRPDILVDDEGHADDLAARTTAIAERVKVDVPENLRAWLAKEFFPLHIKMYSKSRRKAPIYWQLATPSASYSVWLYIHAFSKDTLFRVQNDYVAPKLAHEERRLESLTSELRDSATAALRKQLAAQEALVEELRAFLDEVKRVAPLWNPNLDDGVIINFAPLWRLVSQNKSLQKELKATWDALSEGKYDWAHLAMHLWPERVVPKCAKDRSLAIAHGLEDVFWVEGPDDKWTARKTPTKSVDELVKERTSPAVKSALKSLLEAPIAPGATRRVARRRKDP
ncbi:MAG: BREX-1 system adenine-specific DNA-methyltransferase PglX [Polyangiaceae bacterium]|nr:BREX-1 system adenine-specific DNA-methyltransferase PglX [Polyangiaceae bacterium]